MKLNDKFPFGLSGCCIGLLNGMISDAKKLTHSAEKCAYNTRAGYGIIPGMKKCRIVKIISMMKKGSKIIISRKEKSNGKT